MQEIKKRRIVLASVLKPVDDPRMFEKMGQTLSLHYDVHIFGTAGKSSGEGTTIHFHPNAAYSRFGLSRILAPFKVFASVLKLEPDVLIITTHELLWMAAMAKLMLKLRVVYDVQENYYRNILHTTAFPLLFRPIIAGYVRLKEWITHPLISKYLLAERGYADELPFLKNNFLVVENKVKRTSLELKRKWSEDDGNIHLLFSGTLSPTTGVFVAIELAAKMHQVDPRIRLHLVGFSPMKNVQRSIRELVSGKSFILFDERTEPVAHKEILAAIESADAGIISYPDNPSTVNTMPTKLFEYMGYRLPIILIDHRPWVERCEPYNAAIPFNLAHPDIVGILAKLHEGSFYNQAPEDVFWSGEEERLVRVISDL